MVEKRSRKLSRKEKAALVALIVVATVTCGVSHAIDSYKREANDEYKKSVERVFQMGETIRLDSVEDESDMLPYSPIAFSAGWPWSGSVDLRVEKACLYESVEEAGLQSEVALKQPDGTYFLVVEIELTNIDAEPMYEREGSGERVFEISFLEVPPCGDIPYFDGKIADASPQELGCFDLPAGSSHTYHVGYYVPDDDSDLYMRIGVTDKCTVPLTIERG